MAAQKRLQEQDGNKDSGITVQRAADLLDVTEKTIRNWIGKGDLEAHEEGRRLIISQESLHKLAKEKGQLLKLQVEERIEKDDLRPVSREEKKGHTLWHFLTRIESSPNNPHIFIVDVGRAEIRLVIPNLIRVNPKKIILEKLVELNHRLKFVKFSVDKDHDVWAEIHFPAPDGMTERQFPYAVAWLQEMAGKAYQELDSLNKRS